MNIERIEKELAACKSHEDILELMTRDIKALGYDYFIYAFQVLESFLNPPGIGYTNLPKDWLSEYTSNNYKTIDPIMYHAATQTTPMFWTVQDDWSNHKRGEEAAEFMAAVKNNGWDSGVCIPCFSIDCTRGFINLIVKKPLKDPVEKAAKAAWLCKYYHDHTLRVGLKAGTIKTSLGVRLTPQETCVMRYVADGWTSAEIGKKLGITKRTVDGYIAAVQLKLNADNRQQAICKATNLGLICPDTKFDYEAGEIYWVLDAGL